MADYIYPSIINCFGLIVTIVLILFSKRAKADVRFQPHTLLPQLAWSIGLALFFIAVMVIVNILYGSPANSLLPALFGFLNYGTRNTLVFFAFQLLVAVTEELFFRGWLLSVLRLKLHPTLSVLITSLLFGLVHLITANLISAIFSLVFGLIFAIVKVKFKSCSIYSLMLAHLLYNLAFT